MTTISEHTARYAELQWVDDNQPLEKRAFLDFEPQKGDAMLVNIPYGLAIELGTNQGPHLLYVWERLWDGSELKLVMNFNPPN